MCSSSPAQSPFAHAPEPIPASAPDSPAPKRSQARHFSKLYSASTPAGSRQPSRLRLVDILAGVIIAGLIAAVVCVLLGKL